VITDDEKRWRQVDVLAAVSRARVQLAPQHAGRRTREAAAEIQKIAKKARFDAFTETAMFAVQ